MNAQFGTVDVANQRMVETICAEARSAAPWVGSSTISSQVLDAMAQIPRHKFVPKGLEHAAYHNSPLPIGHGQTISQPYIVALMTDLLCLTPESRVLEVGTGSGYQAAVLSCLAKEVISIEIVEALADDARQRLKQLGYDNVTVIHGNGREGYIACAPYDAVIVTASPQSVPPALFEQLKPGGRMVIPVEGSYYQQELILIEKNEKGELRSKTILPVAFVPLTGV